MALQRLLVQLSWVTLILAVTAGSASADAKPHCQDICGDLDIQYPFGIGKGCYHSPEFEITCNDSSGQPKPFYGENIDVTKISLEEGHLYVTQIVARDCYDSSGPLSTNNKPSLSSGKFWISGATNMFTAVGFDTKAYISGSLQGDKWYWGGCISYCTDVELVKDGSCSGIGCCQTAIPKGLKSFEVTLDSYYNHTNVSDFNNCSYAFVVQKDQFNFSLEYLRRIQDENFPLVLDWAIGNLSCPFAKKSPDYACKDNSRCTEVENGSGYRCNCMEGFEGNPYLGGCQDIDECKDPKLNQCEKNCVNTPANYTCSCPKGYHGDGWKNGTGCIRKQLMVIRIFICAAIVVTVLFVCFSLLYLALKKRKLIMLKEKFFRQNGGFMLQQQLSKREGSNDTMKIFSKEELERATNNYDESRIIGRGGFGTVYKGILTDNRTVAIKKSKVVDRTQIEQFINEVVVLSQINHRNVVKLLGCCLETQVPLLVYEFINNGTLFDHIHNESKAASLSWQIRLRIAAETAGVLSYLHSAASTPIIHRDVKPTNILLDDNYTAKVSDFGASRLVPVDQDELSTLVQGTLGYLDPEYLHTSQLTEKSDVYSFGVVLVELLTGKKALCFDRPEGEKNLAMYFLSSLQEDRLFHLLEEKIIHEGNSDQLVEVAKIAGWCLRVKGEERPAMKEVAMELEGLRVMEKHAWGNADVNVEETEYLIANPSNHQGDGSSSNVTTDYYSIVKQTVFAIDGGR